MKNFMLLILAIVLLIPFGLLGVIFAIFTVRPLGDYWGKLAESLDQHGNAVCGPIFTQWMITSDGYPFGNIDETVSSALGKNHRMGTLTKSGRFLEKLLHLLDTNHSEDAIEEKP